MLGHLKLAWKFALIALMTPLATLIVASVALYGTGRLKYEYDNLYGFMLIPIINLDQGTQMVQQVVNDVRALTRPDLTASQRAALIQAIRTNETTINQIVERYEAEWLTTLSPEFTAQLRVSGKTQLQTDEASTLAAFRNAQTTYLAKRGRLFEGENAVVTELESDLTAMQTSFQKLVTINREFADLSNASAQATLEQMQTGLWVFGLGLSLVSLTLASILARFVVRPVEQLTAAAQQLAQGDLRVRLPPTTRDEVGQMAHSFAEMVVYFQNMAAMAESLASGDLTVRPTPRSAQDVFGHAFKRMAENLRDMVRQTVDNAHHLSYAAEQLAQAATQSGQATTQIATTIQQVAHGSQQQTNVVTRMVGAVEHMRQGITGVARGSQAQDQAVGRAAQLTTEITRAMQQVSTSAQAVTTIATTAAETARTGRQTVEASIRGMEAIKTKADLLAHKIKEMGARSNQIGSIVETIDDIASQTNLLALNAAIEAARAGEHGKGFAVVADEVRKLAEKATGATKEIAGLIKNIQQTMTEAMDTMADSTQEVEVGVHQAHDSGATLANILTAAESVRHQADTTLAASNQMSQAATELVTAMEAVAAVVKENTSSTAEMASESAEVAQAIENIASVSEENAASVEEVSASAEEMSAQVEEVTASVESLAEMARVLQALMSQFTLEAEAPSALPAHPKLKPPLVRPARQPTNGSAQAVRL